MSILVIAFSVLASASTAPTDSHTVAPEGTVDLSLRHPDVQVTLQTIRIPKDFVYKDALLWGGDVGFFPASVVSEVRVREGSKELFVPLSAYSDLGDVHRASLRPSPGGFILDIYGGETATAYEAQLRFAKGYLLSRLVSSNEFPQSAREESRYLFPEDN